MKKKILVATLFIVAFWGVQHYFFSAHADHKESGWELPTEMAFDQTQIKALSELNSDLSITEQNLESWDSAVLSYLNEHQVKWTERSRLFSYLYTAQRDAAFLSYNTHSHFEGSIDPISLKITQLFFPDFTFEGMESDPYSEALADSVFPAYELRYKKGEHPWVLSSVSAFRPPPPPTVGSPRWEKELKSLKKEMRGVDDNKRKAVLRWAGEDSHELHDWREIANNYLFENNVPLAKVFLVRSVLAMGTWDTTLAVKDAKKHYKVPRPIHRDNSLNPLISTPTSPSYPSGHAALAGMASTILSFYFPDETKEWHRMALEAGASRVWAGVHTPIEHEEGREMGEKIGNALIDKENHDHS